MSSSLAVIVLCPNGRRQTVKVTPNTSILEVLEEACRKQGFNPNDYDVRHFNKLLDLSLSVRFASLPNNAMLEMCPVKETRSESAVTVALQLESGDRITDNFPPSSSLYDIIQKCFSSSGRSLESESSGGEPVCIYMRQTFTGDQLKSTTLRSLGLTGGKTALRLMFRPPQVLSDQAHVAAPLKPQPFKDAISPGSRRVHPSEMSEDVAIKQARLDVGMLNNSLCTEGDRTGGTASPSNQLSQNSPSVHPAENICEEMQFENSSDLNSNQPSHVILPGSAVEATDESEMTDMEVTPEQIKEIGEIKYLGPRNAVLFNLEDIKEVKKEDFPDEFFELTVNDIHYLMEEYKRTRYELENEPLMLKSQREAKILQQLARYKQSVIRIYFPEKLVLQGTFLADETVQAIMDFVKNFLEDRNLSFYLYTTPPKVKLFPEKTLLEMRLVPAAVVYFGTEDFCPSYLRGDLQSQVSDPRAASQAAMIYRQKCESVQPITVPVREEIVEESPVVPMQPLIPANIRKTDASDGESKVPKWFKLAGKK